MFVCANCLFVGLSVVVFFLCVCVFRLLQNRSLLKIFVGRTWPKEELTKKEKSRSYFGYKIIMSFQRSHLNAFLMTLAFYLIFHLRDWPHRVERFALSECILYNLYSSLKLNKEI